jgi:hypothetical protein
VFTRRRAVVYGLITMALSVAARPLPDQPRV